MDSPRGKRGRDEPSSGGGDGGGEVSMSVDETNKLRASLGLPPLKASSDKAKTEAEDHKKRKLAEEDSAAAAELEERVRSAKERRRQQELLSKTQKLGAAADDVDDVMAWVKKSRTAPVAQKAGKQQQRRRQAKGGDSDEEEDNGADAAALAGMKVKFGAGDLDVGEEMILTLEDQPILDDKGRLIEDEDAALENVQLREDKQRAKAFKDSKKSAKPLWEEDGKARSLLDKYDEEEEEAMQLDDLGAIEAAKLKRQDDIRAKLEAARTAAGGGGPAAAAVAAKPNEGGPSGDYYTAEEMAAMRKPKKKKERKLKKKAALTADELAALEVAAAETGGNDLGSRADREQRVAQRTAELATAEHERRSRFDAALTKANVASAALRSDAPAFGDDDEEDDDLDRSLRKSREMAARRAKPAEGGPASIAEQLAARRQQQQQGPDACAQAGGLTFTDVGEFMRSITVDGGGEAKSFEMSAIAGTGAVPVREPHASASEALEREEIIPVPMDEDRAPPTAAAAAGGDDASWTSWVPAAEGAEGVSEGAAPRKKSYRRREEDDSMKEREEGEDEEGDGEATGVGGDRAIGSGLAGALAFLKERGELHRPVEWAGRTTDSRDSYFTKAMGGYKDVFTGGKSEDQVAQDVEIALTKKDEYGRVLTPKEAFRQLCHQFHGIEPSRNTRERRSRQIAKELAQRKTATGAATEGALEGLKVVQEKAATPFVVLSGTVRPGQSRDAAGGHATQVDRGDDTAPRLGGGSRSPLVGQAKVEAMLGMMPPPPRAKK